MLNWAKQFNIFCLLDNHEYESSGTGEFNYLLAVGTRSVYEAGTNDFGEIDNYLNGKEWVFGHMSFELKDIFFKNHESKKDNIGFPSFLFFEPRIVIAVSGEFINVYGEDAQAFLSNLESLPLKGNQYFDSITLEQRFSKEEYISVINRLKEHIQQGDCYEINFCQEFFAENASADPYRLYGELSALSPAPFSGFYKVNDKYLLCASPERFLEKRNREIIAQPMKGTWRRQGGYDVSEITALQNDAKERAENVMIVDLMRNDLSKFCEKGSVHVKELYGVYSFPQVHQMVSTVSGIMRGNAGFYDIIAATFPMGSMTGAPKHRVLELTDQYEKTGRGIFSGCIGYFHEGDFDFNVVIRSIMYNQSRNYVSCMAGSGITIYCDAEKEWEECLTKIAAIKKVLAFASTREENGD